ncbi:MAG TPA: phenylalanine--tRNA ligase subunit beta [Candidatus Dormibacteraeota bacterium]|nr:phenylalanine--tRNA ligase subunit beta [Candidatus Dormibacteraeota bacterium]
MRVPLSWLRDYVDIELAPEQLAERLTLLGMEVKGVERWGADWQDVVVGELLDVRRHPRADRLSLTTVTLGTGEPLEIVCGATNIAPGQRVPVALPGAVLPGGRSIERTEKMGVVSNGMLCSGDELRLTSDADGILILPADTPLGVPLGDLYSDVVLDVDVKPNRGDALCLVGLAREVAAATGASVRFPPTEVEETGSPVEERLRVDVEAPALCPRFVGRWVGGVTVRPSPDRVQMRLLAAGMRPVSNVVDASNYVMLELGKPVHTFDAGAIHDGRLVVRLARAGERLETLDHVERELAPETLLIADPAGPLAIAGVMGGASSEVSDLTTDVVVESAIFDPVSIRRTAFRYALRSEASLRFEKGQEDRLARIGADRTARLIREWAGGEVARGRVDTSPSEPDPGRLPFRPARVDRLLGAELSADDQRILLARVGIDTAPATTETQVPVSLGTDPEVVRSPAGETLVAVVPTWRRDLAIEADIAEEVARVRGYELTPSILPDTPMPPYRRSPLEVRDAVREALAGSGLSEVVTHALVAPQDAERFGPLDVGAVPKGEGEAAGEPVIVTNPLSRDHSVMRRSLVGSFLGVVSSNRRHGREDIAIFEVGKGYGRRAGDEEPLEWWRLGFALAGHASPPHWADAPRLVDLDDGKGLAELVARRLGLGDVGYAPCSDIEWLHPGRTARLTVGAPPHVSMSGIVGEVHPSLIEELDLRADRIIVAELAVAGLSGGGLAPVRAVAPPRLPPSERDLAIVVPSSTAAAAVLGVVRGAGGDLLRSTRLFDIYRGAPLAVDEKSLAFRLVFQAPERTLTEPEVEAAVAAVVAALARQGWRIRS